MKALLNFLVLFWFIFTNSVNAMNLEPPLNIVIGGSSDLSNLTELYDFFDLFPTEKYLGRLSRSCPIVELLHGYPEVYPMQYYIFIGDDNKYKVRIQRRDYVPVYNCEEDGPLEYQFVDEIVGEWDMDDDKEFLDAIFEFYEYNRQCRFKQSK